MARGISLHVGINQVDPSFPNAPTLIGCENDARAMLQVATLHGFSFSQLLLGAEATYNRVISGISGAASTLDAGDIFLFTFAGHGSGEVDRDNDELDHQDETILLFDGLLFDDVLRLEFWPQFKAGVRILMVSDSCHSGSVATIPPNGKKSLNHSVARKVSQTTRRKHIVNRREFYQGVLIPVIGPPIQASIVLLAACLDSQNAGDGNPHGLFTQALLDALQSKKANYGELVVDIVSRLLGQQTPVLSQAGQPDPIFLAQPPFTI